MIIAFDFDGVVVQRATYPKFGEPRMDIVRFLQEQSRLGTHLILHTNRESDDLIEAVQACQTLGIPIDSVNTNIPDFEQYAAYYGNPDNSFASRKIYADVYLDDRAMTPSDVQHLLAQAAKAQKAQEGQIGAVKKIIEPRDPNLDQEIQIEGLQAQAKAIAEDIQTAKTNIQAIEELKKGVKDIDKDALGVADITKKPLFTDQTQKGLEGFDASAT